jgi:ATP-binding cassette subfamily F protein uup
MTRSGSSLSAGTTPGTPAASGDSRAARKELGRIERRIEKIDAAEKRLHARLAENATDHERIVELDAELRELAVEKGELEEQWMTLAEDAS